MSVTPYMGLDLPTPSVTTGPEYAEMNDQAFQTVDAHDHTDGKGLPVPSAGMNIDADLTFGNNNATNLRSTRFYPQSSAFTDSADVGCCYVLDADLYYIDTNGNSIRMTENGAISAVSFGGITGLSAPASAAFSVDTFTWKSDTNKYALMDHGDLRLRRSGETSPNYVGIRAPSSLAASYQTTMPGALPASTQFLTLDSSGNIAANIATSLGITRSMQAAVGQQVSSILSGSQSFTLAAWTDVTGQSVSITTTGRPVMLAWQSSGSAIGSVSSVKTSGATSGGVRLSVSGSATTTLGYFEINGTSITLPSCGVLSCMYVPAAGTYTIKAQVYVTSGTIIVSNVYLTAYEL